MVNELESVLVFKIDSRYLEEKGELLSKTIDKWLTHNGVYNTITSVFVLLEEKGDLRVDYHFSNNKNKSFIEKLTRMILDKFNINYFIQK